MGMGLEILRLELELDLELLILFTIMIYIIYIYTYSGWPIHTTSQAPVKRFWQAFVEERVGLDYTGSVE